MSADTSREAFEAWLQIEQFLDGVTIKETDFARRAWQASRKQALADVLGKLSLCASATQCEHEIKELLK